MKREQTDLRHPDRWELSRGTEAIRQRLLQYGHRVTNNKLMCLLGNVPKCAMERIAPTRTGFVVTDQRDYDALLVHIDWSKVASVLDPWAGSGMTKRMLGDRTAVRQTDIARRTGDLDALANAVEDADMDAVVAAFGPFDMVVASPFFELNDLAIGAALRVARKGVAIHVNTRHMGQPAAGRIDCMARYAAEKRLVVIGGLAKSSRVVFNHEWILIFHSEALKNELYVHSPNEYTSVLWRDGEDSSES